MAGPQLEDPPRAALRQAESAGGRAAEGEALQQARSPPAEPALSVRRPRFRETAAAGAEERSGNARQAPVLAGYGAIHEEARGARREARGARREARGNYTRSHVETERSCPYSATSRSMKQAFPAQAESEPGAQATRPVPSRDPPSAPPRGRSHIRRTGETRRPPSATGRASPRSSRRVFIASSRRCCLR